MFGILTFNVAIFVYFICLLFVTLVFGFVIFVEFGAIFMFSIAMIYVCWLHFFFKSDAGR